jgi:hypothetical protein
VQAFVCRPLSAGTCQFVAVGSSCAVCSYDEEQSFGYVPSLRRHGPVIAYIQVRWTQDTTNTPSTQVHITRARPPVSADEVPLFNISDQPRDSPRESPQACHAGTRSLIQMTQTLSSQRSTVQQSADSTRSESLLRVSVCLRDMLMGSHLDYHEVDH